MISTGQPTFSLRLKKVSTSGAANPRAPPPSSPSEGRDEKSLLQECYSLRSYPVKMDTRVKQITPPKTALYVHVKGGFFFTRGGNKNMRGDEDE